MKNFKKLTAMLTALVMLLLCGCGDSKEEGTSKDRNTSSGGVETSWETYDPYSNDEVIDLEGYEFTIASPFLKNDDSGTTAQDIFFRSAVEAVEAEYNCKITVVNLVCDIPTLQMKIMAGDKVADLLDISPANLFRAISLGYVRPLESIQGIDYNDDRWVEGYTNLGVFKEQHYALNFIQPAEARWGVWYNKDILKSAGITENPAELVRNKQWTFDKFEEMLKLTTKDTDNDGNIDVHGLMCMYPYNTGILLANANGGSLVSMIDGKAQVTFTDQKVRSALNYYNKLVNEDKVVKIYDVHNTDSGADDSVGIQDLSTNFNGGKAAFWMAESWVGNQYIASSNSNIDYGFVPLPMGPDADDYVSPATNARYFAFTSTNKDLEKAVPVFNALARYIDENGSDVFNNEIANDYFRKGDTDSLEMYNLCIEKLKLDIGTTVDVATKFESSVVKNAVYLKQGTTDAQISSIADMFEQTIAIYN